MKAFLHNDWQAILEEEFQKPYYQKLRQFLIQEYQSQTVYPPMEDIYKALHSSSYAESKVVILGQDPYHSPGQAQGLCFSVRPGTKLPPSLVNIFKELHDDIGCPLERSGDLRGWAQQGVLLLNCTLTVRQGQPKSHAGQGWEKLTDAIIAALAQREKPLVFILWGAHAQSKKALIGKHKHIILEAPHPSPLSAYRGFFGSKPFSKANAALQKLGHSPIDWCQSQAMD